MRPKNVDDDETPHIYSAVQSTASEDSYITLATMNPDQVQLDDVVFGCWIRSLQLLIEFLNRYGSQLDSCILIDYHIKSFNEPSH